MKGCLLDAWSQADTGVTFTVRVSEGLAAGHMAAALALQSRELCSSSLKGSSSKG